MKKQSIAIIGVIAFVLAVAVGYALFSETLTINGTATAKGSFDYEFKEIGQVTSAGYTKQITDPVHELAVISDDKNTLTITVNKLDYPGSWIEIPVVVENVGTINGRLKNIKETGINVDEDVVKVTYSGIAASEAVMEPGDKNNLVIRVEWPKTHTLAEGENSFEESVEFKLELEYEQTNATAQGE